MGIMALFKRINLNDSQYVCMYKRVKKTHHTSSSLLFGGYRIVLMLLFMAEQILDNDSCNYKTKSHVMEMWVRGNTLHSV